MSLGKVTFWMANVRIRDNTIFKLHAASDEPSLPPLFVFNVDPVPNSGTI